MLELSGRKWKLNVCTMELYNAKNNRETQKHWKDFWKFSSHSEVSRKVCIRKQFSAYSPEDGLTTAVKLKFLHTNYFLYIFLNNRWQKKFQSCLSCIEQTQTEHHATTNLCTLQAAWEFSQKYKKHLFNFWAEFSNVVMKSILSHDFYFQISRFQ